MGACINIKTKKPVTAGGVGRKTRGNDRKKQEALAEFLKARCESCPCKNAVDAQFRDLANRISDPHFDYNERSAGFEF